MLFKKTGNIKLVGTEEISKSLSPITFRFTVIVKTVYLIIAIIKSASEGRKQAYIVSEN